MTSYFVVRQWRGGDFMIISIESVQVKKHIASLSSIDQIRIYKYKEFMNLYFVSWCSVHLFFSLVLVGLIWTPGYSWVHPYLVSFWIKLIWYFYIVEWELWSFNLSRGDININVLTPSNSYKRLCKILNKQCNMQQYLVHFPTS